MRAFLIIAPLAAAVAGCERSAPTEVRPVAGYEFEVRRPGGGYTRGHAATFSVSDGGRTVELKDGRLTIDGAGYGAVADGATVFVDEAGTVTVDGTARVRE